MTRWTIETLLFSTSSIRPPVYTRYARIIYTPRNEYFCTYIGRHIVILYYTDNIGIGVGFRL